MRRSLRSPLLILLACTSLVGCGDEGSGDDELGEGESESAGETGSDAGDEAGSEVPDVEFCDVVSSWDAAWSSYETEVVELVNQNRAAGANCGGTDFAGTGPLTMDPALRCAARFHSRDMALNDYFDHTSLSGTSFVDRSNSAQYDASPVGENIAAGQPTPADVVGAWMESPGHCMNIMNPDANEIGVGYMPTDMATYGAYWTQVFGRR
ncbi:CAP domain-containing protein [Nannocystaceae bacterium ST9]